MKKTIKILSVTINLVIFLALVTFAVIGSATGNFALAATACGVLNLLLISSIATQLSEVKKMVSLMFLTTKATEAADLLSELFNNLFTHSEEDEDKETEQEPKQKKCHCKCESKEPKKAKKKSTAKTE